MKPKRLTRLVFSETVSASFLYTSTEQLQFFLRRKYFHMIGVHARNGEKTFSTFQDRNFFFLYFRQVSSVYSVNSFFYTLILLKGEFILRQLKNRRHCLYFIPILYGRRVIASNGLRRQYNPDKVLPTFLQKACQHIQAL